MSDELGSRGWVSWGARGAVLCALAGCSPGAPPSASHRPLAEATSARVEPAASLQVSAAPASSAPEAPAPAPAETAKPELLDSCSDRRFIIIRKQQRVLELRCGGELAARYQISLGNNPVGRKQREGDGRTPEGEYYVTMKFPSQFHRSLRLSFPNVADADEGLASGTITQAQHAAISTAHATCKEPPQTTALGSLIEIHGAGGGPDVGDWTLGCVAVDNDQIEQIFAFHQPGCDPNNAPKTLVRILP